MKISENSCQSQNMDDFLLAAHKLNRMLYFASRPYYLHSFNCEIFYVQLGSCVNSLVTCIQFEENADKKSRAPKEEIEKFKYKLMTSNRSVLRSRAHSSAYNGDVGGTFLTTITF